MGEAAAPRVVFGLPAYNHAHKLPEALNSILNQTVGDFRVIISDDSSKDNTPQILERYAAKDKRIIISRSEQRLGYIANGRRCFELARAQWPSAPYFAWASDHDVWHPRWLEVLTQVLDEHPDAVLACPQAHRISAEGTILSSKPVLCCTLGEKSLSRRFRKTFLQIAPGNMIYGLMRVEALENAGVLPWHLMPDRLILVVLSLYGSLICVPDYLWYRRYRGLASLERQVRASFPKKVPPYVRLPWWLAHASHIFAKLVLRRDANSPVGRLAGVWYSLQYLYLGARYVLLRGRLRAAASRLAPAAVKTVYRRLRAASSRQLPESLKTLYRRARATWTSTGL